MNRTTLPPKKDCAEPSVAPDVLVLPYAAAAAPGLSFGRRRCRPSPGGVCEPGQDRVLRLRLGRGCVRRVPSGSAALHARQAGLFQDAKPQQRLSPGVPPRPAHPTALLHAPRASQGGLDSSSDHSSRDPPISDGTRAWVADSFVEGQPLSDRRKVARRRALTMDLTGVPSASPPRRGAPPSSPRIAATCPRACSTSATTRTTKSEPLPRPSRCAEGVCLCLGCRSECEIAVQRRRFVREERVCIYVYVFTNNVHDHELREQTNEPEGRLHEKRDQTSAPRTNKQTRRVCSCSANRFAKN